MASHSFVAMVLGALALQAHGVEMQGRFHWARPHKRGPLRKAETQRGMDAPVALLEESQRGDAAAAAGGPASSSAQVDDIVQGIKQSVVDTGKDAVARAMKFTEQRAGAGAAGDFSPKVYKVAPAVKGGLKFAPAEGQNDPSVHVRGRADYAEAIESTANYLGDHAYKDDIKSLLQEVDKSQNYMKGLKLRIVEKENFIDSLVQREDLLQADVNKDKQSLDNLHSHVKALRARIEKIKKQKQVSELTAQLSEYTHAADSLSQQAHQLSAVQSALRNKIDALNNQRTQLDERETMDMQESIDSEQAKPATEAPTEAPAAIPPLSASGPAMPDAKVPDKSGSEGGEGSEAGSEASFR